MHLNVLRCVRSMTSYNIVSSRMVSFPTAVLSFNQSGVRVLRIDLLRNHALQVSLLHFREQSEAFTDQASS